MPFPDLWAPTGVHATHRQVAPRVVQRGADREPKQAVRVALVRLHARPEAQRCSGTSGRAQSSAAPLRGTRWCGEGHPG